MNNKSSVEDAIDKARTDSDIAPLKRLIGAMIRRRRQLDAYKVNEVRARVYLSLAVMFKKGEPTPNIAKRLSKVVESAIVDEYRFRTKLRADESYDPVDERTPSFGDSIEDIVFEQEALGEVRVALAQMERSDNVVDRKYRAAIIAKATGQSVTEAVRRFEPAITPNAAAQTLRRAWERLKAVYMAPKGKKVS